VNTSSYTDPSQHFFWLASRAVGVVALILISLSVGLGLALSGRITRGPGVPAKLKHLHEAITLTSMIAIAGHGLLLLGDSYLRPGLAGIALPFAMKNQPVWTGLGIIGGWLAAILGLSFYARKWITTRVWRWMHRWTLLVYALAIAHTLGSGTDARAPWLLAIIGVTAVPIVFAGTYRFLPREKARRPDAIPTPETPGADPYQVPRSRSREIPRPAPESAGS
jgi:methionine sulfoxide reductase heme-binding subunit